ncbi:hypothetical protein HDU98_001365 [Podochytrium sp. JEL0797]|nr:hypothetical protein HDU98_001365 [Podochytrium sp. JEL0797]
MQGDSRSNVLETGIVMFVGGKSEFEGVVHSITSLRDMFECNLPVEVHYVSDGEGGALDSEMLQALDVLANVRTANLLDYFPELHTFKRASVKPFSILSARFRNVLYMDPDVLFFRNPETLVTESRVFRKYGQLLDRDKAIDTARTSNASTWFHSINPHPTLYASTLHSPNTHSFPNQDSAVILVNKSHAGVLHSLLLACAMTIDPLQPSTPKFSHVGTETLGWISSDLLRVAYRFSPSPPGLIGVMETLEKKDETVCGKLLHFDEEKRPVWWKGGVLQWEENGDSRQVPRIVLDSSNGALILWKKAAGALCMKPLDMRKGVRLLTVEERDVVDFYTSTYQEMMGTGAKKYAWDHIERSIDLHQTQLIDFLMGEGRRESPEIRFGGSFKSLTAFEAYTIWSHQHAYCMFKELRAGGYTELRRNGRCLLTASLLQQNRSIPSQEILSFSSTTLLIPQQLESIILRHTHHLYPWLSPTFPSIHYLQHSFSNGSTGIVFSVGTRQFKSALHAIASLRNIHNCHLPIEIHYAGPTDLDTASIASFSKITNVRCVNLLDIFPTELNVIETWSVKPFAILASSFQTTFFMDADVLFLQPPHHMVSESSIFASHGTLFFHDRSLQKDFPNAYSDWFHTILPHASTYSQTLRFPNKLSYHEQESGVLLVDKSRPHVLHALLMSCALNSQAVREDTYRHVWGDKETFWISWELLRVPYRFAPTYGGVLGYSVREGEVCGSILHVDENLVPLWWNGGMQLIKSSNSLELVEFEYWAMDGVSDHGETSQWTWETDVEPFCLRPMWPEREVNVVGGREKEVGRRLVELYMRIQGGDVDAFIESVF